MQKITAILLFSAILSVPIPVLASASEILEACKIQWKHKYMGIGPVFILPPRTQREGTKNCSRFLS